MVPVNFPKLFFCEPCPDNNEWNEKKSAIPVEPFSSNGLSYARELNSAHVNWSYEEVTH